MKSFADKMVDLYRFQRFAFRVMSVAGGIGAVVSLADPKMYWCAPICLAMILVGVWGARSSTKVLDVMSEILGHPKNGT